MCQFETPLFIIYAYSSVIILSFLVGFSILFRDQKHRLNRGAFYILLIIALWTIGDLIQWLTRDWNLSYFFFRFDYLIDFLFLFILYFAYEFAGRGLTIKKKIIYALPFSVSLVAVIGGYGTGTVDKADCCYVLGWYAFFAVAFDLVYSAWATVIILKRYQHPSTYYQEKLQIRVLAFAIISFSLWYAAYQIVDYANKFDELSIEISPYFIMGNLFFISALVFSIIEYNLFNFSTVPRKWFAFAILSVIFGGMLFLAPTPIVFSILLVFYSGVVWLFWGK